MTIEFNCFPGGRNKALYMSYDDGVEQDKRLVEIFNRNGIRGTFHLNYGLLGGKGRLAREEVRQVYEGHEVSCHSVNHPSLEFLAPGVIASEMIEDRRGLERLTGKVIRGMSYPNGSWSDAVVAMLPTLGIEYARVVPTTRTFIGLPNNFLLWQTTCHHNDKLMEFAKGFVSSGRRSRMQLFGVWGHSYEFDGDKNWDMIDGFSSLVGKKDDVWYATMIEVVDYINAMRGLRFSADCDRVFNPAAQPVWIGVDAKVVEIPPGVQVELK